MCVKGREILYETCSKNNIPHRKIGKLIIALTNEEMTIVEQLKDKAIENGVSSVSVLEEKEVFQMEPNIRAVGALYSPETGIMNAHALMDYYLHQAKIKGADIVYQTKAVAIEKLI